MNVITYITKSLSNLISSFDKSNINYNKKRHIRPIKVITLFGFMCLSSAAILIEPLPHKQKINFSTSTGHSLILAHPPKTDFSRPFDHYNPGKDSLTYDTNEIYKTSFIKEKVLFLLNDTNVVAVNIGTVSFPGEQYYLIMHG